MKKASLPSLAPTPAAEGLNTYYFVWTGTHQAVLDWANSKEGKQQLYPLLHAGKRARIWCPNDSDRIVTLSMQKVGTMHAEILEEGNDIQA